MFETTLKNIVGNDGFIHFYGVVEDNVDPRQLGRLKVRIIGDHTQEKEEQKGIPTEHLPWALIINPVNSASINGIGTSPVGIEQGSWVFGFYLDGSNKQIPVIIGTILGVHEKEPDGEIGFHDPDEIFPMKKFLEEPDTNRLARGELDDIRQQYKDCEGIPLPKSMVEKKGTEEDPEPFLYPMNLEDETEHEILKHKRTNLECNKDTFLTTWHEPITQYNAKYPYNFVKEYFFDDEKHGHVEEWDSTPGYERYHRYHSSGTFLEIFNDPDNSDCGRRVEKIVGEDFEINLKNKHLYIKGDYRVTIDGNKDEHIKGNWFMHLEGCLVWQIDGKCVTMPTEPMPSMDCKDSLGGVIEQTGAPGNTAVKIDVTGNWEENIEGWKEKDITEYETTTTPVINEVTTDINETATGTITEKASIISEEASIISEEASNISNKGNYLSYEACTELEIKATTIIQETCLLLQNIQDMETIITPCSPCSP